MGPLFARVAYQDTAIGQPWTMQALVLCESSHGDLVITGITPSGGQGLVIEAFALRPNPAQQVPPRDGLGDTHQTLDTVGQGFDPHARQSVTGVCDDADPTTGQPRGPYPMWQELAVQFSRSGAGSAYDDGMDVHYRTASGDHVLFLPFAISLCVPRDHAGGCP